MENNTIIENENILNNNEHMNHINMEMDQHNLNLHNITGDDNREGGDNGDGDMKDDLLDSTMENDNLGNVLEDNDLNDLNDELIEHNNRNNTILEEERNNLMNNEHHDIHNIHNNNNEHHDIHNNNENKTIEEDKKNLHQPNENTTLIHGSILSHNNNTAPQNNNDVKNEFNKRNIELEVSQLNKQRRILEEERKKVSEQLVMLENEEEAPELTLSQCNTILNKLKKTHETIIWPFVEPVDYVKYNYFDYPDIVKNPMDLGTIATKLKKKEYTSYYGFVADLNLVWDNCILYNTEYTDIGRWAIDLRESCDALISEALKKKANEKKKSFGKGKVVSQVDEVKIFLEKVRSDPSVLKQPKFQFFKDFLTTFDVNKI